MKVVGKIVPLSNKVLISDMNFEGQRTRSGIIVPSDNGKVNGIHPRWGRVWAIGPEQEDVKVGQWILMEHARWTREFQHEAEDGTITKLHMADLNAIMLVADEKPHSVQRGVAAGAGSNFNFNIPG